MAATLADVFGDEVLCAFVAQFPALQIERDGRCYVVTSERAELPDGFCRFWFERDFAVSEPRFKRAPRVVRRIVAEFVTTTAPLYFISARGVLSNRISSAERATRVRGHLSGNRRRPGSADKSLRS